MFSTKNFPSPLKEKFVSLIIMGILFWLVGICVSLIFKDWTMFILSLIVCVSSFIKAASFYVTVSNKEYETVTGTCVSVTPILIRKQKKVKITDKVGNESTFILSKNSKISIGEEYNFYFKSTNRISLGSEYFDSILSSDCFLGFEENITAENK